MRQKFHCGNFVDDKKEGMASAVRLAHGALFFAAFIYSGWNVVLSSSLESLSPVTFSLCREICAIPLLYLFAAFPPAYHARQPA